MRRALIEQALAFSSVGFRWQFISAGAAVLFIFAVGTVGYVLIEDAGWLDAFYMTAITVTTVGYGETVPLGTGGRIFTVFIVLFGLLLILYLAAVLAEYLLSGQLEELIGQRRMNRQISSLSNHYVVCGYGRTGRRVAAELKHDGHKVVVVDESEAAVSEAMNDGFPAVLGDSGDDDVLLQAGIKRAAGMAAAVSPDADVLMAVLSARTLNKNLHIVARAEYENSESKLRAAGADRVLPVYQIAGRRLAQMVSRPELTEFLEVVLADREVELEMDMVRLAEDSPLDGVTLHKSGLMEKADVSIVGIRRRGQSTALSTPDTVLNSGDMLLAIGTRQQLDKLRKIAGAPRQQ